MRTFVTLALAAFGASTVAAHALEARFVKTPTVGCFDRDILQRASDLRDDHRDAERDALMQDAFSRGACMPVRAGVMVAMEDSDILSGLAKVRAQNEPRAIWLRYHDLSED
ncbi:MAG: hypothetical protein KGM42_11950 [Hyphomicrobiales bacterium]|nr:hypothetical protein [Hyphomicrobiales bacterium]